MQGQQGGGRCGQAVTRSAIASECWQIFREARPDAGSQPVGLHHESIVRGSDAWSKAAIVKGNFRMRYWNMLFQTLGAAAVAPVLGSCASALPHNPPPPDPPGHCRRRYPGARGSGFSPPRQQLCGGRLRGGYSAAALAVPHWPPNPGSGPCRPTPGSPSFTLRPNCHSLATPWSRTPYGYRAEFLRLVELAQALSAREKASKGAGISR